MLIWSGLTNKLSRRRTMKRKKKMKRKTRLTTIRDVNVVVQLRELANRDNTTFLRIVFSRKTIDRILLEDESSSSSSFSSSIVYRHHKHTPGSDSCFTDHTLDASLNGPFSASCRGGCYSAAIGSLIYCYDALSSKGVFADFSLTSPLWQPDPPFPFCFHVSTFGRATLGGKLYIFGRNKSNNSSRETCCLQLDPVVGSWEKIAHPDDDNLDGRCTIPTPVGQKMWLFHKMYKHQYEYDPESSTWISRLKCTSPPLDSTQE